MTAVAEPTYTLRDFQQTTIDQFQNTKSVLIGDDMGLGKTVQAIDLDWQRRVAGSPSFMKPFSVGHAKTKPTLVITKLSVVPEWEQHYEWMQPTLTRVVLDPKDRASFLKAVRERTADVYIMHWDALRLLVDPSKEPERVMAKTQWFHIIGDEIHAIKNRKTKVTRALKALRADYKTGLSGTPADNKPHDLWSILNWLYPNNFRSYWNFYKTYVKYDVDPHHGYHKVTGVRNIEHLQKQMKSFYIRRRKADVLKELPDKVYNTRWVELSPAQRRMYDDMKKKQLAWIGEQEGKPLAAPAIVAKLVRLQQFALATIDVEFVNKRFRSTAYDVDLVAELLNIHPNSVDAYLRKYPETRLPDDDRYHKWIYKIVPRYFMIDPSTKLDEAMSLLEEEEEPLVFFSTSKQLINMFGKRLKEAGISHCLLTGDVKELEERKRMVQDFQAGKIKVFAGTIAAGGIGITLTRSSHVVFFDRAWSPSLNRQAEDRCHRIGQKNTVLVTDIMARKTIDMGRWQHIQQKWTWLQMILGDKELDYPRGQLQAELDKLNTDMLQEALELAFADSKEGHA